MLLLYHKVFKKQTFFVELATHYYVKYIRTLHIMKYQFNKEKLNNQSISFLFKLYLFYVNMIIVIKNTH